MYLITLLERKNLPVFSRLVENYPPHLQSQTLQWIATKGLLEAMLVMHAAQTAGWSPALFETAVVHGHVHILKFLIEHYPVHFQPAMLRSIALAQPGTDPELLQLLQGKDAA